MISTIDKLIIAFYFVFILAIGVLFRRLSKTTSDYFRCGGAMPWWITGTSAWLATFSAWTFTGAAGKVYESGTLVICLYYGNVLGAIVVLAYTGVRFRRLRRVTWMEAVGDRFGPGTELFYTWLKTPILLFIAGVGLNAIGVFMAAVFDVKVETILIVLGSLVTLVAFAGGAWAVLASDFVQMCLIVTISLVTAFLAIRQPSIGSISALVHQLPAAHFHWSQIVRAQILIGWIGVMIWFGFSSANNMENAVMYLMAKSDSNARGMAIIPLLGSLVGPLIFLVPPLVAVLTHPNLAAEFPTLKQPHEAAFVAVARDVLPTGLLGLLLCAMVGATLTNMDAAVNKGVGVFIRSFYKPVLAPRAAERDLLIAGKICTLIFGAVIIYIAVLVNRSRTEGLFDFVNQIATSILAPMTIPILWGMFIKRTPAWSAWTTAILGFAIAIAIYFWFDPEHFRRWIGWAGPLNSVEAPDLTLAASTAAIVTACSAWFFASAFFYGRASAAQRLRVEWFISKLCTPIDAVKDGIVDYDRIIYRLIGGLCLVYGAFILLLLFIPNSLLGRGCFIFCGGVIFTMGAILYLRSRSKPQAPSQPLPTNDGVVLTARP